jgi:hypothetical protein
MTVDIEVSLYLFQKDSDHPVHDFVEVVKNHGCTVEIAPLSMFVKGESTRVFEALRIGYEKAAGKSGCVMFAKACNFCPL